MSVPMVVKVAEDGLDYSTDQRSLWIRTSVQLKIIIISYSY